MDNNNQYRRADKPRTRKIVKRRLRKRAFIPLIILLLMIVSIIFIITSYHRGLSVAANDGVTHEAYEFNAINNNDGKHNILVIGKDREEDGVQLTDTIMILQYDYMSKQTKLVSLMRDIYVDIPGYQSYKINSAYSLGGIELLRETISHNFDLEVEDYMMVDYNAFKAVVNSINEDGILIDVEKDMSEKIDTTIMKGEQRLHGDQLLAYSRFRHDEEGDFGRVRRQQQVINALKDEIITGGSFFKLPYILGTGIGYVETSMSDAKFYRLIASFLVRGDKDIDSFTLPLKNTYYFENYSHAGNVIMMDFETNNLQLQQFLDDEISEEDVELPEGENIQEFNQ